MGRRIKLSGTKNGKLPEVPLSEVEVSTATTSYLAVKKRRIFNLNGEEDQTFRHKKWQATYITLLRPSTLAAFPPWGIQQELVV